MPETLLLPYEARFDEQTIALWRTLHPDWTWLNEPETVAKAFELDEHRLGYAVQREGTVIGTVFGSCARDATWHRNRYIHIEAQPEDLSADWLAPALASFAEADRGRPDTWHVASPVEAQWPILCSLLEALGFTLHSSMMTMEWTGEKVTLTDPGTARLDRYTGGNPEIDQAIIDLHNRSYRAGRLTPPADIEYLWKTWPGLTAREYVLAWDEGRLVGYAEWFVYDDKPTMNSLVAARSHWGTSVAAAAGTKAMELMLELGYRTLQSSVISRNAASIKLQLRHGWRITKEQGRTYVCKLGTAAS